MDLILWRHAQAQVGPPGWVPDAANAERVAQGLRPDLLAHEDLARALTPKGERQAERMAAWLHQRLPESTRVLVSPAVRAQQTALALGRAFKTVASLDPDAPPEALLEAARWPRARDPVLVVGHQPAFGLLVAQLLQDADTAPADPWSIKKGAVWWIQSREREGRRQVTLQAVQNPELL
jgi:phosphohistidine phosphatase